MICKPVCGAQHSSFMFFVYASASQLQQYRMLKAYFARSFPSVPFLPCRNDFFAVLCRVCLSSSQHFLFSLALPFPAPLMLHLSVFLFSTFVGSRFRLSAPSSVPFSPQKKLRPGRQSRAVLLPESNVHSFASDGESLQTKPQAMQFTSGAELFRQFCFSKTAAKPAA